MLGRRHDIGEGRVHDQDALSGRRLDVDVVEPDARTSDHLEILAHAQDLGVDLGGRTHQPVRRVGAGDRTEERRPLGPVEHLDVVARAQQLEPGPGNRLGDQYACHPSTLREEPRSRGEEQRVAQAGSSTMLRSRSGSGDVSNVELFFDLVYVFAVTQLSHHLVDRSDRWTARCRPRSYWRGLVGVGLHDVARPTGSIRGAPGAARLLLVLMLASLLMSAAVPRRVRGTGPCNWGGVRAHAGRSAARGPCWPCAAIHCDGSSSGSSVGAR